jgi:hypothetical protein
LRGRMVALLTRVDALAAALAPNGDNNIGSGGGGHDSAHNADGTAVGSMNGASGSGSTSGSGGHSMVGNSMAGAALALLHDESARAFDALRASFGLAMGAAPAPAGTDRCMHTHTPRALLSVVRSCDGLTR